MQRGGEERYIAKISDPESDAIFGLLLCNTLIASSFAKPLLRTPSRVVTTR